MTVLEAIELYQSEMINEVYNSTIGSTNKEILLDAIKEVTKTVTDTYHAELQPKK